MFIAPAAYPPQVVDVFLNAVLLLFVALMIRMTAWKVNVPLFVVISIAALAGSVLHPRRSGRLEGSPSHSTFDGGPVLGDPRGHRGDPLGTRLIEVGDLRRSQAAIRWGLPGGPRGDVDLVAALDAPLLVSL
jgi:hypothetical protein